MENEIIELWEKGLSKYTIADIYKTKHNMFIKLVRTEMHNRHAGKLISKYEALAVVEKVIYKKIMKDKR